MATFDAILDQLWLLIVSFFTFIGHISFTLTSLLHPFGPAITISAIAFLAVPLTKILNRVIITQRYIKLEKEFTHWHTLRQEAINCEDKEKGQRMARNIDQAKLNKAYYDYFFEGLLLGMARKVIPIFFFFAFVNEMYRPEQLEILFGQGYVLVLSLPGKEPLMFGAVFWFFISLIGGYIGWYAITKILRFFSKNRRSTSSSSSRN